MFLRPSSLKMRGPILVLLLLSAIDVPQTDAGWLDQVLNIGKIVGGVVGFVKTAFMFLGRKKRDTSLQEMADLDLNTMCEKLAVTSLSGVTLDVIKEAFKDCDTDPKDGKLHGDEMKVFEESVGFISRCLE